MFDACRQAALAEITLVTAPKWKISTGLLASLSREFGWKAQKIELSIAHLL